jgi:hypothetical protein
MQAMFVPLMSVRGVVTWAALGVVAIIAAAAGVDAFRSDATTEPLKRPAADAPTPVLFPATRAYPRCERDQLALVIIGSSRPDIAIRLVRGDACRRVRLRLFVTARDSGGQNRLSSVPQALNVIAGISRPGVLLAASPFNLDSVCFDSRERERLQVKAHAGPYVAVRTIRCP